MSELPNNLNESKRQKLLAAWQPQNFDLLGYAARILRRWRLLLVLGLLGAALGVVKGLLSPRYYASGVTFMPPPAELNSTATAGTSLSLLSSSLQGDMFLYLMSTRTLVADVTSRLGLAQHYGVSEGLAQYYLRQRSTFDVQRAAVVGVTVRDTDPVWAAKIANGYVDALYRMEGNMVTSAYSRRREFFEDQLALQRGKLEKAEDALAASQQKLGNLSPDVGAGVEQGQEIGLQSQIDALDTQIAVSLKSQTEQNPQIIALRNQQNALRAQLEREKTSGLNPDRGIQGLRGLPQTIVQQSRKARDVAERNTVYQGVLSRYQITQAAEVDPGPSFEVIDAAIPIPVKEPSKAPTYAVEGALAGFVAAILWILLAPVVLSTGRSFSQKIREA